MEQKYKTNLLVDGNVLMVQAFYSEQHVVSPEASLVLKV